MEALRDIQGLDRISVWPLAVGWWFIIALAALVLLFAIVFAIKRYRYMCSWQYTCYKNLTQIQQQLSNDQFVNYKKVLHQLATEVRRIAMQAFARESCAGLAGIQWLQWLQQHDPYQFDWDKNGQVLISYQYMPQIDTIDVPNVKELIAAAKQWVKRC